MRTGDEGDTHNGTRSIRVIRACGTAVAVSSIPRHDQFVERIAAFDLAHVPEQLAAASHIDEHGGPPAP